MKYVVGKGQFLCELLDFRAEVSKLGSSTLKPKMTMKKIWNVLTVVALVGGMAGCNSKTDETSANGESAIDSTKVPTAEQQKIIDHLLDSLKVMYIEDVKLEAALAAPLSFPFNAANFPTVGDHNIAINKDSAGTVYFRVLKVDSVQSIDCDDRLCNGLATYNKVIQTQVVYEKVLSSAVGVRVAIGDKGKSIEVLAYDNPKGYGSVAQMTFDANDDVKIFPKYDYSGTTAIIGGQDTRDSYAGNVDYLTCDLEFKAWPNQKQVMIWYDGSSNLIMSGNKYTKVLMVKHSQCDLNFRHWGSKLELNHLSSDECPKK